MKIAIPTTDDKLDTHFGHCSHFTFIEVNETDKTILTQSTIPSPPHEPGVLPVWIAEQGADLVITGGIGQRAIMLLEEKGVKVIIGAPSLTAKEIVQAYFDGSLENSKNSCSH